MAPVGPKWGLISSRITLTLCLGQCPARSSSQESGGALRVPSISFSVYLAQDSDEDTTCAGLSPPPFFYFCESGHDLPWADGESASTCIMAVPPDWGYRRHPVRATQSELRLPALNSTDLLCSCRPSEQGHTTGRPLKNWRRAELEREAGGSREVDGRPPCARITFRPARDSRALVLGPRSTSVCKARPVAILSLVRRSHSQHD